MSDPYNQGDTVGRGDMEETVDTGGVNPGQVAGSNLVGGGDGSLAGDRSAVPTDEEFADEITDHTDTLEREGGGRRRFSSIEEMEETLAAEAEENARLEAEDEADVEAARQAEAEKDAAREEAHANNEAFYEGDTRHDGEDVQEWSLPDGTIILVNEDGEAVSVEWPPGEGPVYIGDVIVGGEPCSVWEVPTGAQIVVDADGNTIGTLDEVDVDDIAVDKFILTGDVEDIGTQVVVEYVPGDDYSNEVRDAETGEVYATYGQGDDVSSLAIYEATDGEVELHEDYSLYLPPGSDQYIIIDENGQPVGTVDVPQEPEWSLFGVVEYYEDGEVVVNIGDSSVSVDVVGPDGGISVDLDLLVAEGTAGIEWSEDGSWEFDASVDVDMGATKFGGDLAFGEDAAGNLYLDVETYVEMTTGLLNIEGGQHFHFQETDEGFEMNVGWEGKVGTFGFYVEREQDWTVVVDEDGSTWTYQDMVGAGHEWMGGVQLTYEGQVRHDEDGFEGATGLHGRIVDSDGDELVGGGTYLDSELGGPNRRNEQLDTGREYERQYDDGAPDAPDPDSTGNAEAGRFGIAGQEGEEATGRLERAGVETAPEGIHDIHMNQGSVRAGQKGEEDAGAAPDESPEVPRAVTEALAGRYAEVGSNASRILGQTEGSNWRMAGQDDDDALMRPSFGDGAIEPERFYDKGNQAAGVRDGDEPEGVTLPGVGKLADDRGADSVYVEEVSFRPAGRSDSDGRILDESSVGGRYVGETEKNLDDDAASGWWNPDVAAEVADRDADGVFVPGRTHSVSDDLPEGAQLASDPPPSEEDADEAPPAERPKIWQRRDGEPTDPDDEDPVEPTPTPRPRDEWPEIATERLRERDEDGDGVPDRWGPDGPILGDDITLDDVTGAPPARRTAEAGADQSTGGIARPDGDVASSGEENGVEIDVTASVLDDDITAPGTVLRGGTTMATGRDRPDGDVASSGEENGVEIDVTASVLDDDIVAPGTVLSGGTKMASDDDQAESADEPYVVEEPIAMHDADRGQLPDGYGDGKRSGPGPDPVPAADLIDDIAPVAPAGARPEPAVATEPAHAPAEPEQVAEVETAVPGYQALPELDAVMANDEAPPVELVVDLAGDTAGDDLMTDAGTMELDDQADDQLGDG